MPGLSRRCSWGRRNLRRAAITAATFTASLALVVLLLGWVAGNHNLTRLHSSFAAMVPSTASLFVLTSAGLVSWLAWPRAATRKLAQIAGALTILACLTNIALLATGAGGLDRWLWPDVAIFKQEKMSVVTSANFLLAGTGLLLTAYRRKLGLTYASIATVGLATAILAFIVFAFDASSLYRVAIFSSLSMNTAICFTGLFIALLCARPESGWMAIVSGIGTGSVSARRLLPLVLIVPFGASLLAYTGIKFGLFDPNFALSLMAMAMMSLLSFLVMFDASKRNQIERQYLTEVSQFAEHRAERHAQLRSDAYFQVMAEATPVGIFQADKDGRIHFANQAMGDILGEDVDHLVGQKLSDALQLAVEPVDLFATGGAKRETAVVLDAYGEERWARTITSGLPGGDSKRTEAVGVLIDDTENRRMMEALRETRDQAQAAARAKSSFLANMSHEIRTPMNGVLGFAQLLMEADLDPQHRKYAELINESGHSMVSILNDILDFSKIESGRMVIRNVRLDLFHAIRSTAKLMQPMAEQKQIDLQCEIADNVPQFVFGDDLRLRQILSNILGNAIKFTASGSVRLTAYVNRDDRLILTVTDTGIGIAEDRIRTVFEEFVQADNSTARQFGGTGLGLPISRELARLIGGDLSLSSTVGEGTCVIIDLPLNESEAAARPETVASAALPTPAPTRKDGCILVAEDNDINQILIRDMITDLGYSMDLVANGQEAVDAIARSRSENSPYSMVLMDIQMPMMDGLEATRKVREMGISPEDLPVIAFTANAYETDIAACHEAGMQAHLVKPIRKSSLRSTLSQWTGRHDLAA